MHNLSILRIYDYKFTFRIAAICNPRLRQMVVNQEDDYLKAFLNDAHGKEVAKKYDFKNK